MGFYQFEREQVLYTSLDVAWDFITSPLNLQVLTPPYLGFQITSSLPETMYEGMIISYIVRPLFGIKTAWVTEITHIKDKEYFIDEQRSGPYAMWHHQHILKQQGDGVLMKDIVSYKPPFGFIGAIANEIIIKNKLSQIFDFRKQVLEKMWEK